MDNKPVIVPVSDWPKIDPETIGKEAISKELASIVETMERGVWSATATALPTEPEWFVPVAEFHPLKTNWHHIDITINWPYVKTLKAWRRHLIAIYIHELVHAFDWFITCRRNMDAWLGLRNAEQRANRAQDIVLALLGLRHDPFRMEIECAGQRDAIHPENPNPPQFFGT